MNMNISPEEVKILPYLVAKGVGKHKYTPSSDLDIYDFYELIYVLKDALVPLENKGFLKLVKVTLDPNGYAEDLFFEKFLNFIASGKQTEAEELANSFDLSLLTTLSKEGLLFYQIGGLGTASQLDRAYGNDLCGCLQIEIEILEECTNFVLKNVSSFGKKEITAKNTKSAPSYIAHFDPDFPLLDVRGKRCQIRKHSKQYEFMRVIFTDKERDWQFSEIAEKIDQENPLNWKIFYNYCNAIKTKIASDIGIKDFFISTTQSVKINPKYLEQPATSGDDFDNF